MNYTIIARIAGALADIRLRVVFCPDEDQNFAGRGFQVLKPSSGIFTKLNLDKINELRRAR
jgi:hypothetical protein